MSRIIRPPSGLVGLTGVFALLMLVGYPGKAFLLAVDPARNATFQLYADYHVTTLTVVLILIGIVSFGIGIVMPLRFKMMREPVTVFPIWIGLAGVLSGVAAFLWLVVGAGLSPFELRPFESSTRATLLGEYTGRGLLGLGISLMPLFLLLLYAGRPTRYIRWLCAVLVLGVFALLGSRLYFLGTVVSIAVYHLRLRGRRHDLIKQLLVVGCVGLAGAALGALLFSAQERVTGPYDLVVRGMGTFDMADTLAVVEAESERFAGLTLVEDAAITYIPRAAWLDKPFFYGGYRLQETAFPGIGLQHELRAFFPVGLFGEIYLNFGYLGLAVLPMLLAVGLRWLDCWSTRSVDRLAVCCFLYGQLLGLLRSPGQFAAYTVVVLIVWTLARYLAVLLRPDGSLVPPKGTTTVPITRS